MAHTYQVALAFTRASRWFKYITRTMWCVVLIVCLLAVASGQVRIQSRSKEDGRRPPTEQDRLQAANVTIPYEYPMLKQCVDDWGDDIMVTKTICQVGCLMSSTSMGLAGTDIKIPTDCDEGSGELLVSNPGTFNKWLQDNSGYDDDNDFIEPVAQQINPDRVIWPSDAMHKTNDLSYKTVVSYLEAGRVVIGNVMEGGHFVLLTGYSDDGDTFSVNDPGFSTLTYSYANDIVGYRIFDMKREQ